MNDLRILLWCAELARKLTGDEIESEVCRELRGRNAFWKADPPIIVGGETEARPRVELFNPAYVEMATRRIDRDREKRAREVPA